MVLLPHRICLAFSLILAVAQSASNCNEGTLEWREDTVMIADEQGSLRAMSCTELHERYKVVCDSDSQSSLDVASNLHTILQTFCYYTNARELGQYDADVSSSPSVVLKSTPRQAPLRQARMPNYSSGTGPSNGVGFGYSEGSGTATSVYDPTTGTTTTTYSGTKTSVGANVGGSSSRRYNSGARSPRCVAYFYFAMLITVYILN
jgi:hypothetical protein